MDGSARGKVNEVIQSFAKQRNTHVLAIVDSACPYYGKGEAKSLQDHIDDHADFTILSFLCKTSAQYSLKPLDLILHTPGGLLPAVLQIALALSRYPAPVTVFVPYWA